MFGESEAIKSFLKNIIRCGKVSSIDSEKGTARIVFDDDNELVSHDLPVLQRNALRNKDYAMPDVNENVVCVFLPIGGVSEGFVVGSFYAGNTTPPESVERYRTVVFSDGTRVRYDRAAHELSAEISSLANRLPKAATTQMRFHLKQKMLADYILPAGVRVTNGDKYFVTERILVIKQGLVFGDVMAVCTEVGEKGNGIEKGQIRFMDNPPDEIARVENTSVTSGGEDAYEAQPTKIVANRQQVLVNTPNCVIVTAANNVQISTQTATITAQSATITAPTITLQGDVSVTGSVTAGGDVTGGGISLMKHVHTGNLGSPTSSPQ